MLYVHEYAIRFVSEELQRGEFIYIYIERLPSRERYIYMLQNPAMFCEGKARGRDGDGDRDKEEGGNGSDEDEDASSWMRLMSGYDHEIIRN